MCGHLTEAADICFLLAKHDQLTETADIYFLLAKQISGLKQQIYISCWLNMNSWLKQQIYTSCWLNTISWLKQQIYFLLAKYVIIWLKEQIHFLLAKHKITWLKKQLYFLLVQGMTNAAVPGRCRKEREGKSRAYIFTTTTEVILVIIRHFTFGSVVFCLYSSLNNVHLFHGNKHSPDQNNLAFSFYGFFFKFAPFIVWDTNECKL